MSLFAFAGLVRMSLRSSPLPSLARNWLANACVIGFAFGSPLLLLLGNLSIYDEAIIWGLALSLGAIFFAFRSRQTNESALTHALLGFSLCAGGALLARATFGAPLLLIAPFLALRLPSQNRIINLTALVLPLAVALIFYIWLIYARFGNITGLHFDYYIDPVHSDFVHRFGVFSPRRIPYSFADYFSLRFPSLRSEPPYLAANRHSYDYPSLFSNDFSEVYLPLPWGSGWLVFGAIMGITCLVDVTVPTCLSGVRLWLSSSNLSASYPIFRLPNVTPLIFSFPDFLSHHFSQIGRRSLVQIASRNDRTNRALGCDELAWDHFLVSRLRHERPNRNPSEMGAASREKVTAST